MNPEIQDKEVKLHLGCGNRHLDGYIHIDLDTYPHIDYLQDIRELPMFMDETVDLIYSCGAIQYFDRNEVKIVLKEWRRVLKTDGILRLSVPDFESIVKVYLQNGKNLDARGILGPLFGKWLIKSNSSDRYIYQTTTYDYKSLRTLLNDCSFKYVKRYDWREVLPSHYDDYSMAYIPHMDQENGLQICLNVEATNA